jgi:phosphohistidine swiveling domain-containing protein
VPRERILVDEWRKNPSEILKSIIARFPDTVLVVRSSTSGEDGLHASGAGKFLSILGVPSADMAALRKALDEVVASYGRERDHDPNDEVLVQPQLRDIIASGVMLTRDPRSGAPYFVINEDRTSGRSDTVTGGSEAMLEQRYIAWSAADCAALDENTRTLTALGREIAQLSTLDALDIEYAFDRAGHCHLLQVRPLAAVRQYSDIADEDVFELIAGAQDFARACMRSTPTLLGKTTILGVMPDWNPAEMIGTAPRPLALSLYQRLIGDTAWAEARHRIGYRDLRSEQLILSLAGRPFVDVRASLNSFLPATLDDAAGTRWVDACLERLRDNPRFHDKLEFEVAITCLTSDFETHAPRLREAGVDAGLFREHLRTLTAGVLSGAVAPIADQYKCLDVMNARRARIVADTASGAHGLARSISQLLGDCRGYGVVPFSILARYGFISMSLLRGMLTDNIIARGDYDAFLREIPTVAGGMTADLAADLPLDELVARYGHLRPNSYDITSPNYAADAEHFLRPSGPAGHGQHDAPAAVLEHRRGAIDKMLAVSGLDIGFDQLTQFLADAITGREKAKFEFMKNLDAALERTAQLGERLGLDRQQMSFLPIADIVRLETDSMAGADRAQLQRRASYNEKRWSVSRHLRMPDLVRTPDEIAAFRMEAWRINFITSKTVRARAVWLDDMEGRPDLKDAIVVLRAADPGYDWIFAHGIAGLITEYGGVASHMAIRSAEFGLPAAIGCGGLVLEALRGAMIIELDCANERVRAA